MAVPADQAEAAAFLAGLTGEGVAETHISAIYLGPDEALKLKKAVDIGFLDFTRLAERERLIRREHALNAPHAPGLYLGVEPITRGPDGALRLGGEGEAVEWVLRMRRLPPEAFLGDGPLDPALLDPMADAVVALHAAAPHEEGNGDMTRVITGNRDAGLAAGLPRERVLEWERAALAAHAALVPWLAARAAAGFRRRCHGDLHLGNLCLIEGQPRPFDALEFDEALATIDVGYDLAFLLMDLVARHGRAPANRVLNRYLARTGDVALVRGLPLWLSLRAFIRAHVTARVGQDGMPLLNAAASYLDPAPPPRLVAIGGLQGTGKSVLARDLAPDLGAAPGAVLLRSDEIRKRRAGVLPETRLPGSAYAPEESQAVFAELNDLARIALDAGHSVIADAVFQRALERDTLAAVCAHFHGIWLEAPLDILRRRVAARTGDASDATIPVLEAAALRETGPIAWARINAMAAPEPVARKILDLPPLTSP
ncbi:MAG: hypothetical protein JWR10_3362 [Rubritepida sp.]|nr:hypothetical protein [Rubritepida sp.]